jgi:meiotically up-regulated gene 157 (Mug157) protein
MSITYRALTAADDSEIRQCLRWLRDTTAGTGFMHESFKKDDASSFTRPWFAWANTLFGELILKLAKDRPALLAGSFL